MNYKIINGAITLGNKTILEEINFEIKNQEHIALIGKNGTGKTTLLRAINQEIELETGLAEQTLFVTNFPLEKIGYIHQDAIMNEEITMLEEILTAYTPILELETKLTKITSELSNQYDEQLANKYQDLYLYYQNIGGYNYKKEYETAIKMFGFSESDKSKKIKEFSFGQRTKIAFLKLLLSKPDLLLLDEPTNHLDLPATLWLEDYLKNYPKMLVVVSHDRMFLDNVCNITYEIAFGSLTKYSGNYSFYEQQKKLLYKQQLQDYEYQQREIARLQRIADRFRYKPTKASMAMSKLKQIEKMTKLDKPQLSNHTFSKNFIPKEESYRDVLKVKDIKFGYEHSLGELSFCLEKGQRLGIIGANGTGKTTFLKTILGLIPKLSGKYTWGNRVSLAYFDQNVESLPKNATVLEVLETAFSQKSTEELRQMLGSFEFTGEMVFQKVSSLSGGQKVKLLLCKIMYQQPNVLILDEPTNHLDILSKQTIEDLLLQYPGTIIFISHDRYLINKIATSLIIFTNNTVQYFPSNYSDYLEKKPDSAIPLIIEDELPSAPKNTSHSKYTNSFKEKSKLERKITKVELEIQQLETKITNLTNEMLQEEIYLDYQKMHAKESLLKELNHQLDTKMTDWEELLLKLEQ